MGIPPSFRARERGGVSAGARLFVCAMLCVCARVHIGRRRRSGREEEGRQRDEPSGGGGGGGEDGSVEKTVN